MVLSGLRHELVAHTMNGQEVPRMAGVGFELLTQRQHVRIDRPVGDGHIFSPHQVDEPGRRHRLALCDEQDGEDGPLPAPPEVDFDRSAGSRDSPEDSYCQRGFGRGRLHGAANGNRSAPLSTERELPLRSSDSRPVYTYGNESGELNRRQNQRVSHGSNWILTAMPCRGTRRRQGSAHNDGRPSHLLRRGAHLIGAPEHLRDQDAVSCVASVLTIGARRVIASEPSITRDDPVTQPARRRITSELVN